MHELEIEHLKSGHSYSVSGCKICEKDALIDYQNSIIKMVFDDYITMVGYVDRVVKGIRAYHMVTEENVEAIIPTERSRMWVPLTEGILPFEGEEVNVLVRVITDEGESHAKIRGYRRGDHWYSQEKKNEIKNVTAWQKIRGQLPAEKPAPGSAFKVRP